MPRRMAGESPRNGPPDRRGRYPVHGHQRAGSELNPGARSTSSAGRNDTSGECGPGHGHSCHTSLQLEGVPNRGSALSAHNEGRSAIHHGRRGGMAEPSLCRAWPINPRKIIQSICGRAFRGPQERLMLSKAVNRMAKIGRRHCFSGFQPSQRIGNCGQDRRLPGGEGLHDRP
jgi:hypothetical protein